MFSDNPCIHKFFYSFSYISSYIKLKDTDTDTGIHYTGEYTTYCTLDLSITYERFINSVTNHELL